MWALVKFMQASNIKKQPSIENLNVFLENILFPSTFFPSRLQ